MNHLARPVLLSSLVCLLAIPLAAGQEFERQAFRLRVAGADVELINVPLVASIPWPDRWPVHFRATVGAANGPSQPAQIVHSRTDDQAEVHFVWPRLPANEETHLELTIEKSTAPADASRLEWRDTGAGERDVVATAGEASRPLLRYMHAPLDESSPQRREETYKPYHHVFAPDGHTLLTKGPGGKFPHHRGLYFGFNKVTYGDGRKADVWHCRGDAYQSHERELAAEAGPVLASHQVAIDWHGVDKEVFAHETRELTVYNVPEGQLIDFTSTVRTAGGPIQLDGDPQHAGFHFRAAQEVAESTTKETYYLRSDGRGAPGETRNWPDQPGHANLPWNAMSFVVGGQRYTALYLDHPDNPKEARYSERDYGRFGSYFEYELTEERPLAVRYRVWVQPGELAVEQAAALSTAFVNPPQVTVEPIR